MESESENRPRKIAKLSAALSALALLSGCSLFPTGMDVVDSGHHVLAFTLLGDTALALQVDTWHAADSPDSPIVSKQGFARLDRRTGKLSVLDTLPGSAAPTFQSWFFACDSGKPISVHPPGFTGPAGSCTDTSTPAVSPNGYRAIYADSEGTVHLFGSNLEQFESLRTGARRVEVLDAAFGVLSVSILEWHDRGDTALWRGFAVDDPSGSDSAWLVSPGKIRVHGHGTELVCGASEESLNLAPCWSPPGVSGFREAFAQAANGHLLPEWDPETGVLAYLDRNDRFVFLNPATGSRVILDAGPALSGFRP